MKRPLTIVSLALAAALALAGCGNDNGGSHGSGHGSSSSSSGGTHDHNSADVEFLTGMVPHHEQAVEMSALAKDRASSPEVTRLAAKIEAAQGPEIETMQGWLKDWGEKVDPMDHGSGGHGMTGMMSKDEMSRLEAADGAAFDRLFLQLMIRHHEGAIALAQTVQDEGKSAEVKALAEQIEADQTAESARMQQLLSS